MTSQPGKQTIAIHLFPKTSGSKDNQAMKFGQLIEKSYANCAGESSWKFF